MDASWLARRFAALRVGSWIGVEFALREDRADRQRDHPRRLDESVLAFTDPAAS